MRMGDREVRHDQLLWWRVSNNGVVVLSNEAHIGVWEGMNTCTAARTSERPRLFHHSIHHLVVDPPTGSHEREDLVELFRVDAVPVERVHLGEP